MHIAIFAAPLFPVPPRGYGAIELIVGVLVDGLVKRGIEVTLFALGESQTSAHLESIYFRSPWPTPQDYALVGKALGETIPLFPMVEEQIVNFTNQATFSFSRAREIGVDLIHCHRRADVLYQRLVDIPILLTLHGPSTERKRDFFASTEFSKNVPLVTISHSQRRLLPGLNHIATIHHGIDLYQHTFQPDPEEYLAFLGRIGRDKGCSIAIDVARKVGLPLKIAGQPMGIDEELYFKREIEPKIDEKDIQYLGWVNHEEKVALLGGAKALLFPIVWDEAFGIVMIEAMACGTPVIAFRKGAVPEIVTDGVTGFIVDTEDGMVEAVCKVEEISRAKCRAYVEKNFTADRMVDEYIKVYERLLSSPCPRKGLLL